MDEQQIKLTALQTGLSMHYISKEDRITQLLEQLSGRPNMTLKGGTALSRAYLTKNNAGRFSEDIDIDYASNKTMHEKIKELDGITSTLKGYEKQKPRLMGRTLRFDMRYVNDLGKKDTIRLEFHLGQNKIAYTTKPEKTILKSITQQTTLFTTYSLEDLTARKLIALYNRAEGKDIYDVYHALQLPQRQDKLKKAITQMKKAYSIMENRPLFKKNLIKKLEEAKANIKYIQTSTNHYIPAKIRPNWPQTTETLQKKIEETI